MPIFVRGLTPVTQHPRTDKAPGTGHDISSLLPPVDGSSSSTISCQAHTRTHTHTHTQPLHVQTHNELKGKPGQAAKSHPTFRSLGSTWLAASENGRLPFIWSCLCPISSKNKDRYRLASATDSKHDFTKPELTFNPVSGGREKRRNTETMQDNYRCTGCNTTLKPTQPLARPQLQTETRSS